MTRPVLAGDGVEQSYAGLIGAARQVTSVEETLARILASWSRGQGALPQWIGLGELEYRRLLQRHFPAVPPRSLTRPDHPPMRDNDEEMDDLRKLLLQNRSYRSDSEPWLAEILVVGCLANDHLWQDLGLWSRADLSQLMSDHFKPLAELNTHNMKWKKFLYKRLCETEGIYTCRAPSCAACADYANCFAPET